MKKWLSVLLILALSCSLISWTAAEEPTEEYRDSVYGFRYPASWSLNLADNGDIVLLSPDGNAAVLTFAIITDLIAFTGDPETDAPYIEAYVLQYEGKNLALNGEYEMIEREGWRGVRAYGTWLTGNLPAVMVLMTGERHMFSFVLVGEEAIALEEAFLSSVELYGAEAEADAEGFLRWQGTGFSLAYPAQFGSLEQTTGVAFIDSADANSIIMARAYTLDYEYSDEVAPLIASATLPKSAKLEAEPVMEWVGGRRAAVISGDSSAGPIALYVVGSGRTALTLMFLGNGAVGYADAVVRSVQFE